MPLRDFTLTVLILVLLPVAIVKPWLGILAWSWIGYMNPHRLAWDFAFTMPYAMMVAVATLIGVLVARDSERRPIPWSRETVLLLALWVLYTLTTLVAYYPDEAWPQWSKVSKILLFTFLTLMFFQNRERLRALFLVVAVSLGFYGVKGGLWVLRTGGTYHVRGPEGSFIESNNDIGLALTMALPFLLYLAREEKRPWVRRLLLAMFAFSIIAVIFTYSRGAMLGLPVVLAMLLVRARRRLVSTLAVAALALYVIAAVPEHWFTRMETIPEYQADPSARGRLVSWKVAWGVALDRPLTGGGFWVLPHPEIFALYAPTYRDIHSAHSIYFAVLGDHGFPALFVFVGLILSCFGSLRSIRLRMRGKPEAAWLINYCHMLEASLMAYAISGAFLTQAYWDMFYHLVSFVVILKALASRYEAPPAPSPPPRRTLARAVPRHPVRPR